MTVELLHVTHTAMRSRRQTNTFNSRQAFGYDFQVTTFSMPVYLILTFSFVGYAWPGTPKKQKQKKQPYASGLFAIQYCFSTSLFLSIYHTKESRNSTSFFAHSLSHFVPQLTRITLFESKPRYNIDST